MTETDHYWKTDGTIIIQAKPAESLRRNMWLHSRFGLLSPIFRSDAGSDISCRRSGGYASHRMPPILSNITGLSLFIAPFVQIPTTLFALIGGLIRNKIISNCIAWPLPISQILWMICEIPHGETTRGVGTLLTTRASPFSLKLITTLESYLIPCLMSVIWVYFIVQVFIPTVKTLLNMPPDNARLVQSNIEGGCDR